MPTELAPHIAPSHVICPRCKGSGSIYSPEDCGFCRGEGEIQMAREDRLFVVVWSSDGESWKMVKDDDGNYRKGPVPAAYVTNAQAEARRDRMAGLFPDCLYEVVVFRG